MVGEGPTITGSIVGFEIDDGGSNYDFPPFVEIIDDCKQGYGAVARSVIDYDEESPTYGQVIDIYIVSEGENYPVSGTVQATSPEPPYVIDDIVIVEPGTGYTNNDTIINASTIGITTSPISYKIQVGSNGDITKVLPINSQLNNVLEVEDLPVLKVISETGYGATLKAKLKPRKQYQGEVKQQIDCIGK